MSGYKEALETVGSASAVQVAAAIRDGGAFFAAIADAYIAADAANRHRLDVAFARIIAPRLQAASREPVHAVQTVTVGHTVTVYAPEGKPDTLVRRAIVRLAECGAIGGWTVYNADGSWLDGNGDTVREPVRAYQVTVGDTGIRSLVDATVQALADAGEHAGYVTAGSLGWIVDLDHVRADRFNAYATACTIAAAIADGKR